MTGAEKGPEGTGQDGANIEDECLWTVFQRLVDVHGRTRAARLLGVNYRTVVANLDAGRLSRRMRSAVLEHQESGPSSRKRRKGRWLNRRGAGELGVSTRDGRRGERYGRGASGRAGSRAAR